MRRLGTVFCCIALVVVYWLAIRGVEGIRSWPVVPVWWRDMFRGHVFGAVAWFEILRLVIVTVLSVPFAIATKLVLRRYRIAFALGVGILCAVTLKAVVIANAFIHSDTTFKVMLGVETASLLLVLPLLVWGMYVLPSNNSLELP